MKEKPVDLLPEPFGQPISEEEWARVLQRMLKHTPNLNVYDGFEDMTSQVLYADVKKKKSLNTMIIDELRPDHASRLISKNRKLLVRAQYFEAGLQYRLSFHAVLTRKVTYKDYPALELRLSMPVKRVANVIIQIPRKKRPVYMEVMVEGGKPQVRMMEPSAVTTMPFSSLANHIPPKSVDMDGARVQLVDVSEHYDFYEGDRAFQATEETRSEAEEPAGGKTDDEAVDPDKYADVIENPNFRALLILDDRKQRERWRFILKPDGWTIRAMQRYTDIQKARGFDPQLLVMDMRQGAMHAMDQLRTWKDKGWFKRSHVLMLGRRYHQARPDEWPETGDVEYGFGRFTSPIVWQRRQVRKWFPTARPLTSKEAAELEGSFANATIYVVENDPKASGSLSNSLSDGPWELVSWKDPRAAVRTIGEDPPGLFVIDFDLPRQSGLYALKSLRKGESTADVPVVVVTASKDQAVMKDATEQGIQGFLYKPFETEKLKKTVKQALLGKEEE
ncbi:response regulator [bacterium]|nr:response regulator [bacterium]